MHALVSAAPPTDASSGVTRLLAAAAALTSLAEAPACPTTDRLLTADRLFDLLSHASSPSDADGSPSRAPTAARGFGAGIDGTRALSLFLPSYQTVLQGIYAIFTRVLPNVPHHCTAAALPPPPPRPPVGGSAAAPPGVALRLAAVRLLAALGTRDAALLVPSWQVGVAPPGRVCCRVIISYLVTTLLASLRREQGRLRHFLFHLLIKW